jgi:hypothetical protein
MLRLRQVRSLYHSTRKLRHQIDVVKRKRALTNEPHGNCWCRRPDVTGPQPSIGGYQSPYPQ